MSDPNLSFPSTPPFPFPPKHTSYPPFFSLQPTLLTRHAQLKTWSRIVQSYCRHYRLHKLVLSTALDSPLLHNQQLKKRMSGPHLRELVKFMVSEGRAEWIGGEKDGGAFWVWWKRPEEWAEVLAGWVCYISFHSLILNILCGYEKRKGGMDDFFLWGGRPSRGYCCIWSWLIV